MKPPIEFRVNGLPVGQPRPRAFARKMGDKFVARVFDSNTAEGWKSAIAAEAQKHRPDSPFTDAVRLTIDFYFLRPKSHFGTGKNIVSLKPNAPLWKTGKPDIDNLEKAVMDAITMIGGFWLDDAQVASNASTKRYSAVPGASITITELPHE